MKRVFARDNIWAFIAKNGPIKEHMTTPCWEWLAGKTGNGYGVVALPDRGQEKVHRLTYAQEYGPIPVGLSVLHHCDNEACVRPDHLYAGTHAQNMRDTTVHGNRHKGDAHHFHLRPETRPIGEHHGRAKLFEGQVLEIRSRKQLERVSYDQLSDEYGVAKSVIASIIRRETWKHI